MKKFIIVLYSMFLLSFTIFSYAFVDPNLSYLKNLYSDFAFSNRFLTTIFYVTFILIFFIFYGVFVWLGLRKKLHFKDAFLLVAITVGILLFSYPAMLSFDIFNYIATARVLFFYHENPYIIMPIEFVGDPLLSFTHAANKIALYGPSWILITAIPYFVGIGNFLLTLFSFKLFVSMFYLGTVFLIWKISKNIISVFLFSLNPLIIIETLVSGHNDIVMIFFTLLSFFFLMKKKIFPGILFFILSILIKYATILLIPLFLYVIFRIIKKKEINWKSIFYLCSLLMYAGFLLSPIREEIYPWYALWFLSFNFLILDKKLLLYISLAFSFGLLFRYVPFILLGTHAGLTPVIKSSVTFIPVCLVLFYFVVKKIWERIFSR